MTVKNLIKQLSEQIENEEMQELFYATISSLGEDITVDDVLNVYENIGNQNNEIDSNSASKAIAKIFGTEGSEGSGATPLHKKFNNDIKTSQEASHNTTKKPVLTKDTEDEKIADYAQKLNDDAKSKIKALKPNDKALPENVKETIDFTEDINALFEGTELSEDFKEKALLIFESSVSLKINQHINSLNEEMEEYFEEINESVAGILSEEIESFKEETYEKIDQYLDLIVEEFMKENSVSLESGIKVEIAESMFQSFKNILSEHNIDIADEKIDLVDEVIAENDKIVESYNKEVEKNIVLNEEVKSLKKELIIKELSEDLTALEAEKLSKLLESVEFTDEESFLKKSSVLIEAYSTSSKSSMSSKNTLNEDYEHFEEDTKEISSDVSNVIKSLNRINKK